MICSIWLLLCHWLFNSFTDSDLDSWDSICSSLFEWTNNNNHQKWFLFIRKNVSVKAKANNKRAAMNTHDHTMGIVDYYFFFSSHFVLLLRLISLASCLFCKQKFFCIVVYCATIHIIPKYSQQNRNTVNIFDISSSATPYWNCTNRRHSPGMALCLYIFVLFFNLTWSCHFRPNTQVYPHTWHNLTHNQTSTMSYGKLLSSTTSIAHVFKKLWFIQLLWIRMNKSAHVVELIILVIVRPKHHTDWDRILTVINIIRPMLISLEYLGVLGSPTIFWHFNGKY